MAVGAGIVKHNVVDSDPVWVEMGLWLWTGSYFDVRDEFLCAGDFGDGMAQVTLKPYRLLLSI